MNETRFNVQEIDLIDLFWRLLEQWRGIAAVGLLFALLLSVAMFVKSGKAEEAVAEELTEETATEDMYRQACTALSQYAAYMLAKDAYDRSILNRNNFNDCISVTYIYQIHADEEDTEMYTLTSLYSAITADDAFTDSMVEAANKYWEDVDSTSLYELLTVSTSQDTYSDNPRSGMINVNFRLPDGSDTKEWRKALTDAIDAYHDKIGNIAGSHSVKLVLSTSRAVDNSTLVKQQNERYSALITAKNAYETTFAALGKDDQSLVEQIIKEAGNSYDVEDYIGSLDKKLEALKEAKAVKKATESAELAVPPKKSFSIKYFILGLFLGAFLYVCVYLAYFILVRLVRRENELESAARVRNFGGIYRYPYTGTLSRFIHDKKVYDFRTRKKVKTVTRICDDIISKLEFAGLNDITLVSVGKLPARTQQITDEQVNYLEDHNISVKTFNIESGTDSVKDSVYAGMDNVLIEMLGNSSKWKDLTGLYFKLKEYNISIIGSEYIEV